MRPPGLLAAAAVFVMPACVLNKMNLCRQRGKFGYSSRELGLAPGTSLYLEGINVTKQKGFDKFNVARSVGGVRNHRRSSLAKWKRLYRGWAPDEGWFILTNLDSLSSAITAYRKRFDIEEMFRDCKIGGYNMEGTKVSDQRLIVLILLITIAYSTATMQGKKIKRTLCAKICGSCERTKANTATTQ